MTGRPIETATSGGMSAYRSLAKWAGVDIDVVLRCVETGKLARLVEARSGGRVDARNTARIAALYRRRELQAREVPPWK